MISKEEYLNLNSYLNRLQGQVVRVEFSSRLNLGFRISYALKVEKQGDNYNFNNETVSIFVNPNEAEAFSSDQSSVTLLYGDNLITIRYSRTR